MVIRADDAALEYRKEVFGGVAVFVTAKACELLCAVIDGIVSAKLFTQAGVHRAFICHKVGAAVHIGNNQSADVLCVDVGNVKAENSRDTILISTTASRLYLWPAFLRSKFSVHSRLCIGDRKSVV